MLCRAVPLQVRDLKAGKAVDKPIYNHVSGNLDAPEKTESPNVSDSNDRGWQTAALMVSAAAAAAARRLSSCSRVGAVQQRFQGLGCAKAVWSTLASASDCRHVRSLLLGTAAFGAD